MMFLYLAETSQALAKRMRAENGLKSEATAFAARQGILRKVFPRPRR